jgi:hypothetical protein
MTARSAAWYALRRRSGRREGVEHVVSGQVGRVHAVVTLLSFNIRVLVEAETVGEAEV